MTDTLILNPRGFTAMSHDEMMATDGGLIFSAIGLGVMVVGLAFLVSGCEKPGQSGAGKAMTNGVNVLAGNK
jgi:hypothetical protein